MGGGQALLGAVESAVGCFGKRCWVLWQALRSACSHLARNNDMGVRSCVSGLGCWVLGVGRWVLGVWMNMGPKRCPGLWICENLIIPTFFFLRSPLGANSPD